MLFINARYSLASVYLLSNERHGERTPWVKPLFKRGSDLDFAWFKYNLADNDEHREISVTKKEPVTWMNKLIYERKKENVYLEKNDIQCRYQRKKLDIKN